MRSPLGLAADPGGLPLYKAGTPVGGVGVIADGVYGFDAQVSDRDLDTDELLALAATFGYAAPDDRRADRITADGKTLRFSDATFSDLQATPATAPAFASVNGSAGVLVAAPGYNGAVTIAGTAFGQAASGVRPCPMASAVTNLLRLTRAGLVLAEHGARFVPEGQKAPILLTLLRVVSWPLRATGGAALSVSFPVSTCSRMEP